MLRRVPAKQMQQDLAELFGARNSVTYDLYTSSDKTAVNQQIKFVFPGTSEEEINQIRNNQDISQAEKNKKIKTIDKENEKLEKLRVDIVNAIWAQNESDSTQCCMIFVDENGRVYQNWTDYRTTNTLPAGVLVAPYNGVYDFDNNNMVIADAFLSPASFTSAKVCRVADTGAGYLGIGVAAIPAAALFFPIAAPILAASAVSGISVGIWSLFRSGANIYDRRVHEQSIDLSNNQARGAWLGLAGGILGMGAGAAASGLGSMAASGAEVSEFIKVGVTGISLTAITVNCVGVGHSAFDMLTRYKDDDEISAYDLLQLGASLFMVTHSVYNYRSATAIIEDTRSQTIRGFRTGLSNSQRKMFNKMYKETLRIKGQTQGKVDIIRSLRNIPDKGQFFSDIYKVNKHLNQNKLRPSFRADGSISINNDVNIDSTTLRSNFQGTASSNSFPKNVAPIPKTHAEAGVSSRDITFQTILANPRIAELRDFFISSYSVLVVGDMENALSHIFQFLKKEAAEKFLEVVQQLFDKMSTNLQTSRGVYIPFEQFLWDVFNIAFFVSDGNMNETIFNIPLEFFERHVTQFYDNMFPRNEGNIEKCSVCRGYYTLCELTD